MKQLFLISAVSLLLVACGSSKQTVQSNAYNTTHGVQVQTVAGSANNYKIIPSTERVSYTIPDPRRPKDKKRLKGLTLDEAKAKVLAEAVIEHGCAILIQPTYSFEMKGKKVARISVYGYPAVYDFGEEGAK